jgi:hypothetical protein
VLLYRKMVGSGLKDVVLSPWEVRLRWSDVADRFHSSTAVKQCPLTCLRLMLLLLLQGMWHVFQASLEVPEAQEAAQEMAAFFKQHLQ